MSYDLNAYVRRAEIPSTSTLRDRLRLANSRLELVGVEDLMSEGGFVPVLLDGEPTGFEIQASAITQDERDSYRLQLQHDGTVSSQLLEILDACDLDIWFGCKAGDTREITAARIVATLLAEASHGWVSDPQTGETTSFAVQRV